MVLYVALWCNVGQYGASFRLIFANRFGQQIRMLGNIYETNIVKKGQLGNKKEYVNH